jgi:hypothetical protein
MTYQRLAKVSHHTGPRPPYPQSRHSAALTLVPVHPGRDHERPHLRGIWHADKAPIIRQDAGVGLRLSGSGSFHLGLALGDALVLNALQRRQRAIQTLIEVERHIRMVPELVFDVLNPCFVFAFTSRDTGHMALPIVGVVNTRGACVCACCLHGIDGVLPKDAPDHFPVQRPKGDLADMLGKAGYGPISSGQSMYRLFCVGHYGMSRLCPYHPVRFPSSRLWRVNHQLPVGYPYRFPLCSSLSICPVWVWTKSTDNEVRVFEPSSPDAPS